jgi:hypothetical protein
LRTEEETFEMIDLEHKCYARFPEIHYTRFDKEQCSLLCNGHCFEGDCGVVNEEG